jgi:hypothetical protein
MIIINRKKPRAILLKLKLQTKPNEKLIRVLLALHPLPSLPPTKNGQLKE